MGERLRGTTVPWGVAIALALALAAVWLFLIAEEKSVGQNTAERLALESLASEGAANRLNRSRRLLDGVRDNLAQIDFFRQNFLERKQARIVGISRFLEERARARGLRLAEVRYQSERARDRQLEVYSMDLPLVGRYRDLRALIDDIERSDMFLMITRLDVQDANPGEGAVQVQLSLATFFEGAGSGQ